MEKFRWNSLWPMEDGSPVKLRLNLALLKKILESIYLIIHLSLPIPLTPPKLPNYQANHIHSTQLSRIRHPLPTMFV